jgi:membrane protein
VASDEGSSGIAGGKVTSEGASAIPAAAARETLMPAAYAVFFPLAGAAEAVTFRRMSDEAVRPPFYRVIWDIIWRALRLYDETDGEQRAASFAYYAFFALFPLILLMVSITSSIFQQNDELKARAAASIVSYVEQYMPITAGEANLVVGQINALVQSRRSAGIIASLVLMWSALRFFQALVRGVNRAWGTKEYSWWRLPIKNLLMVAIVTGALFLGIIGPLVLQTIDQYWRRYRIANDFGFVAVAISLAGSMLPTLVLFFGFAAFYKFAPRGTVSWRYVWIPAFVVTVLLQLLRWLFVLYASNVANFNAVYGTLGAVVATLMWIYLTGTIIILGGCLSAAHARVIERLRSPIAPETKGKD